jgi:WD40 repeat protein
VDDLGRDGVALNFQLTRYRIYGHLAIVGLIASVAVIQAAQESRFFDRWGDPLPPGTVERLGTLRFRHPYLMSLACLPDGRTIVTSGGGLVRLWDSKTGKEVRRFGDHLTNVWSAACSPDGKIIAASSMDRTICLWNIATGAEIIRWQDHGANELEAVVFAPDGRTLASAGEEGAIRFWDAATGRQIKELLPGVGAIWSLTYSRGGTCLAAVCHDQIVRIWEVSSGKETMRFTAQKPVKIAFSENGAFLACASKEGLTCWNMATGKAAWKMTSTGASTSTCFSPDGHYVAAFGRSPDLVNGRQGTLWLCNAEDGKKAWSIPVSNCWVNYLTFAPDGKSLVGAIHWEVCRWDVATGRRIDGPVGHAGDFRSVAYSPDGKIIGTAADDMTVRFWNAADSAPIRCLPGISLAFSPNGNLAATGGPGRALRIWELSSGKTIKSWTGPTPDATCLAFSPDGHTMASKSVPDTDFSLWDADTGREVGRLPGQAPGVCSASYCQSGKLILTVTPGSVHLWDAATYKEVRNLPGNGAFAGVPSAAFSLDGKRLAFTDAGGKIHIWDVVTDKQICLIAPPNLWPYALAFSPDGRLLAAGTDNVCLWEVATTSPIRQFRGHGGDVNAIAFSPDGRRLCSGSGDSTALVWDLTDGADHRNWQPASAQLETLWADLAGDAGRGEQAVWKFVSAPQAPHDFWNSAFAHHLRRIPKRLPR